MNKRLKRVTSALVDAVRAALEGQRVTEGEWRVGVAATVSTASVKELA